MCIASAQRPCAAFCRSLQERHISRKASIIFFCRQAPVQQKKQARHLPVSVQSRFRFVQGSPQHMRGRLVSVETFPEEAQWGMFRADGRIPHVQNGFVFGRNRLLCVDFCCARWRVHWFWHVYAVAVSA